MKYKLIAITSLIISVVSLACALTSERRAQVAAERTFAERAAELERQITEQITTKLTSANAPVVYSVINGRAAGDHGPAKPDYGLWHPTLPPKRVD